TMVDQLRSFSDEVTRVAREVGTEGKLGGQADVKGVSGTWKDLTDSVNGLASNLTDQVRNIALVTTAVANGDLSKKITVDVKGEILELKNTINVMVDQLRSFAAEVTRVAREVGTEGKLGGQAAVEGVAGTWKDLTDNVNFMASNLTNQVRNIATVTTAVAMGDLSQKITVDARGEIMELKNTINVMVDQLSSFASEVTRVAREVGTEGKLGGQARVPGVAGTWKDLTDNVNFMASTLTAQVRAISEVATAVTQGDLTRSIAVEAQGEVLELKDNINRMIVNLRETTQKNQEQDWLKTNLAKFSGMMQGQKNLESVSRLIMSELTPLVGAHHGAFFIAENEAHEPTLKLIASYAYRERKNLSNRFRLGEGLVGQCALERKGILLTQVPSDYITISSGLGESTPLTIIVLPVLFEGEVKAVVELASFLPFSQIHRIFLDQLSESIGVVLNMIEANMRTEQLLQQSQSLTQELQSQSLELQTQQNELRRSNLDLEEKAALLEEQNRKVEIKNREVELARLALEEKAEQLALASKYKSEFLANMSHELRTPLNSLLILAKLLSDNKDSNLSGKQVEFANTIYSSGLDLLNLINEILDLAKVESGKMAVDLSEVMLADVSDYAERTFRPIASSKGLAFDVVLAENAPRTVRTDQQRLQQILKNLLSNAFKFTEEGRVALSVGEAPNTLRFASPSLARANRIIAFSVIDTGIGIPKDKQQLIFESFQQADGTTSRKYGGTGLGLTISRELARLLGGEIRVESQPGQGSTFTLYVPQDYLPSDDDRAARDLEAFTREHSSRTVDVSAISRPEPSYFGRTFEPAEARNPAWQDESRTAPVEAPYAYGISTPRVSSRRSSRRCCRARLPTTARTSTRGTACCSSSRTT
ncbi:MAG TPA: ATP-binding protein, partial [Deinococcales bacterium]|nr:ATP-binding protein [Deinococcales bacterium]